MKFILRSAISAAAFSLLAVNASAVSIKPTSYSYTPGTVVSKGTYLYPDSVPGELTDGKHGINRISNQTEANPWIGWLTDKVEIDFVFDKAYNFDSVTANVLQLWLGNIVVPDFTLFASNNGSDWTEVGQKTTDESSANDYKTHALTVDGFEVAAKYLRVTLTRNAAGPWIFTDEVTFNAVPEGGATLVLLGLGFLGLAGLKRKAS